jgi:hypothetical protein
MQTLLRALIVDDEAPARELLRALLATRSGRIFSTSETDSQEFLVSQMRLNDELAKALDALERRKLLNLLSPLFPSRTYLALITNTTP